MHTPEQAKALWCPMVRVAACNPNGAVANGQTVFNRLQNGAYTALPDSGKCIAEHCAMWRRLDPKQTRRSFAARPPHTQATQEPERPSSLPPTWVFCPYDPTEGIPAGWIEPESESNNRRRGYCGLAGSPAT